MNKEQAINVLIQVAHLAQSKGLLNLKDATIVANSIEVLTPKQEDSIIDKEKVITTEPVKLKK